VPNCRISYVLRAAVNTADVIGDAHALTSLRSTVDKTISREPTGIRFIAEIVCYPAPTWRHTSLLHHSTQGVMWRCFYTLAQ